MLTSILKLIVFKLFRNCSVFINYCHLSTFIGCKYLLFTISKAPLWLFFRRISLIFRFDNDLDLTRMRWLEEVWKMLHTHTHTTRKRTWKAGNFHQIFSSIREIKEKRIYVWACGRRRGEVTRTFCRYAWITRGTSLLNSP